MPHGKPVNLEFKVKTDHKAIIEKMFRDGFSFTDIESCKVALKTFQLMPIIENTGENLNVIIESA